ncbi:MAG: cupin domain-containing protein [Chloroflexi bacterium]|nr:cupin domain-containing protein [Chloroflexota bacterium]
MSQQSAQPIPPLGHRSEQTDTTAPDGSEIRFLIDHRHHAQGASVVEVTLPPGQVSRPVCHQTVEEVWYILEGNGKVWRCPPNTDPSTVEAIVVIPGDALTIPTGWRFQFSSSESGPLRFLCVTIPPWPGPDEAQPADFGGLGAGTV